MTDLAARSYGGTVMAASDDFFADKENLLNTEPPTFQPHTFTAKGQQYDGWETRRRFGRGGGGDWALIRLGAPGVVRSVTVDTSYFLGNYPESCRVEATGVDGYPDADELASASWFELLGESALKGGELNQFTVDCPWRVTHVRLHIRPDGGVARLRVHGEVVPDPRDMAVLPFDLAATVNGAVVTGYSDSFFSPPANMLQPGESRFMSDGWETARRRDDGHDWATVKLACRATPLVAEVATTHYRGNSPDRIALSGMDSTVDPDTWFPLLPQAKVQADTTHRLRIDGPRPVTHVRLESHPDGGIARFRLYGTISSQTRDALSLRWFNLLPPPQAIDLLTGLYDIATATRLVAARPATSLPQLLNIQSTTSSPVGGVC